MDFEVITPKTKDELLTAIAENQERRFRFGAGFTDLIHQFKHQPNEDLTIINISQLKDDEYRVISEENSFIRIGTLATATDIVDNSYIKDNFPVLGKGAPDSRRYPVAE